MKNIILLPCIVLLFWGCTVPNPDQEFSIKGTLVENCDNNKSLSNYNLSLVCRDVYGNIADKVIPFTTNLDGSFYVKGEPNFNYYFIMNGSNQISKNSVLIAGMGPGTTNIGLVPIIFDHNRYYPVIIKYDMTNSSFNEGDTVNFDTTGMKFGFVYKTSKFDFTHTDTVFFKGDLITSTFPDSDYLNNLFIDNPQSIGKVIPNFGIWLQNRKRDGRNLTFTSTYFVHYRCDKYPVVTVKIP